MSIANSNVAPATETLPVSTDKAAMAMVTTLFFMWGFLTCLNDILIPHLKAIFDLSYAKAMLIQFSFFGAYFVFALPSGRLIEWFGYKKAMVGGLVNDGIGSPAFRAGGERSFLSVISYGADNSCGRHHAFCRYPPIRTWRSWAPKERHRAG